MHSRVACWIAAGLVVAASAAPVHGQSGESGVGIFTTDNDYTWNTGFGGASFGRIHGNPVESGPFAFRMRMPAEWTMMPHTHNTGEYITVLSGALFMKFAADDPWVELPPGSAVTIPGGQPMWAHTEEQEVLIQIHGVGPFETYPLEDGDASEGG